MFVFNNKAWNTYNVGIQSEEKTFSPAFRSCKLIIPTYIPSVARENDSVIVHSRIVKQNNRYKFVLL